MCSQRLLTKVVKRLPKARGSNFLGQQCMAYCTVYLPSFVQFHGNCIQTGSQTGFKLHPNLPYNVHGAAVGQSTVTAVSSCQGHAIPKGVYGIVNQVHAAWAQCGCGRRRLKKFYWIFLENGLVKFQDVLRLSDRACASCATPVHHYHIGQRFDSS